MEKTNIRSLVLLMIITGVIFTACGSKVEVEVQDPGIIVQEEAVIEGGDNVAEAAKLSKSKTPAKKKVAPKKTTTTTKTAPKPTTDTKTTAPSTTTIIPVTTPVVTPAPEVKVTTKYTDGTYTKSGNYTSPAGGESITVTVTVKNDVVEALTVLGSATNSTSQTFQGLFIGGIKSKVVGKKLADVSVGVVNGSSLTGSGFNNAINGIKAAALK